MNAIEKADEMVAFLAADPVIKVLNAGDKYRYDKRKWATLVNFFSKVDAQNKIISLAKNFVGPIGNTLIGFTHEMILRADPNFPQGTTGRRIEDFIQKELQFNNHGLSEAGWKMLDRVVVKAKVNRDHTVSRAIIKALIEAKTSRTLIDNAQLEEGEDNVRQIVTQLAEEKSYRGSLPAYLPANLAVSDPLRKYVVLPCGAVNGRTDGLSEGWKIRQTAFYFDELVLITQKVVKDYAAETGDDTIILNLKRRLSLETFSYIKEVLEAVLSHYVSRSKEVRETYPSLAGTGLSAEALTLITLILDRVPVTPSEVFRLQQRLAGIVGPDIKAAILSQAASMFYLDSGAMFEESGFTANKLRPIFNGAVEHELLILGNAMDALRGKIFLRLYPEKWYQELIPVSL